ncbi:MULTISPECIES: hypothetical protein [Shewanella]|uniref:Uncharacterized protein n=1 Tax=Shewanella marisflavi TaxID=260364 RepID=A0ABX5WQZ8_9GAMM|nr:MULTISPECIES: hypothetical protein [Shewanella]QDF76045.1 hypothetical protein FGA12_13325 [Shewanella marisflavi]
MRHFLHALKWILFTLLLIPVGGYLILLLVNLQDSEPSAQASAYLEQVNAEEAALSQHLEHNPYLYAFGFDAPKDDDPMALGLKRYQALKQLDVMQQPEKAFPHPFELPKSTLPTCRSQEGYLSECINLLTESNELQLTIKDYAWLIERYRTLISLRHWQDDTHFNLFINPIPGARLIAAQHLYILNSFLKNRHKPSMFLADIDQDMRFWLQASTQINLLHNKLMAISILQQNMKLGEALIEQMNRESEDYLLPSLWQRPMPKGVLSLERVKRGEWHYFTKISKAVSGVDDKADITTQIVEALLMPLMQPQDTANRYADILIGKTSIKQCPNELSLSTLIGYAYNPMGKFILCSSVPPFEGYQARTNNLESQRQELIRRLTANPANSAEMETEVSEDARQNSPEE